MMSQGIEDIALNSGEFIDRNSFLLHNELTLVVTVQVSDIDK
jgi:hypothetical protein